jgi:peroxiredoxin
MIKVGDRMPLFKAMAQDGKEYSSSDLLGKKTIIYAMKHLSSVVMSWSMLSSVRPAHSNDFFSL